MIGEVFFATSCLCFQEVLSCQRIHRVQSSVHVSRAPMGQNLEGPIPGGGDVVKCVCVCEGMLAHTIHMLVISGLQEHLGLS